MHIFLLLTFAHLPSKALPMPNDLTCNMKAQEVAADYMRQNGITDTLTRFACVFEKTRELGL